MQFLFILFLLLIPAFTGASEHRVPAATQGNKLILSVQNSLAVDLKNVKIAVQFAPSWLVFGKHEYIIETIPGSSQMEALFEFRVLDVEAGLTESVNFVISNEQGTILGKRVLEFTTFTLPKETKLGRPYPNPANPTTTISYELNQPAYVKLDVFNILGQRVKQLLDTSRPAGAFSVIWEGTTDSGRGVASGNYVIRMTVRDVETNQVKFYNTKVLIQK